MEALAPEATLHAPPAVEIPQPGALENRLIEAIQPIRHFVQATAIHHLFDSGLYDALLGGAMDTPALAHACGLDTGRLEGFLHYLQNEDLVAMEDGRVVLTARARGLEPFRPWYTMLIGGYGGTFMQVGESLRAGGPWATRAGEQVGIGACGISHFDSIPLTRALMADMDSPATHLLDLGCGNGLYLVEFCKELPGLHALGVEPDPGSCRAGRELVRRNDMGQRIELVNAGAIPFLRSDHPFRPDFAVLGFVLHEILGQEGEEGVVRFLSEIVAKYPAIHLIVIEVEHRTDCRTTMNHGLALAYYNPYYLLHTVTHQQLVTDEQLRSIFARAGLELLSQRTTDPAIDSTGLEIGYLLRQRG